MTTLKCLTARGASTEALLETLEPQLDAVAPRLMFAFYGCRHDDALLHRRLLAHYPGLRVMGGSSAGGVLSEEGPQGADSIGLLCIEDDAGDYGVAAGLLGDDPTATAERLLHAALADAGAPGELPELVWIYQAPGREEKVLEGLRRVVGDRCPIIGGSSADDDVSGQWRELGPQGPLQGGLAVAVLFPSAPIGYAFQGGHEPAGPSGIVTGIGQRTEGGSGAAHATSGREILAIDGAPAARVYNDWTGGAIARQLEGGGTVLAQTTLCPLSSDAGSLDGLSQYLLIHPEAVTAEGALRTFCDLRVGTRVFAMRGDRQRLIERAGRVVAQARRALPDPGAPLAGLLMIYCGGCKLAVGDEIAAVTASVREAAGHAPFLVCFTYGEQGRLLERNVHGNLMISAIAFAR